MNQLKTKLPSRWTHAFQRLWALHWVMAACFLAIYGVGILMTRLPHEVVFRGSLYNVHKSMGVLVLSLLLFRIFTVLQVFIEPLPPMESVGFRHQTGIAVTGCLTSPTPRVRLPTLLIFNAAFPSLSLTE